MAKRVVSFLPSATELIYELGAGDMLVGVTHECTYPEEAKAKPKIIRSVFDPKTMTSRQIDQTVSEIARSGKDLFIVDEDSLKAAEPDLIIAQGTCAVCSAYTNEVSKALQILDNRPQVEVLDPQSIEDILVSVVTVARHVGLEESGARLVESLQKRIDSVKRTISGIKPKVLCIEWVEPFFTSGHWVPQMVEIAGGQNLVSNKGEHSRRMSLDEIESADPDVIVMMPCGFDTARTAGECASSLSNNARWKNLRAVREGQVYGVDANGYFSKPSIRTITGIEILAKILHPAEFAGSVPEGSFRRIAF
ncbi:cobalamin-binding protein [Candidatus Nitrosotenuis cloacae]|uniref:cobalamin-binding protein n=1 Tax=Candidatus Nitrosotenuis cloacae TaxID=1603555 RepID=UPI0022831322|nr:cobalamin-binding protein [Candidatus Nitrosotenuis cloacae]